MNTNYRKLTLALAMVGLTASVGVNAQQQSPILNDRPANCDGVNLNQGMVSQYPQLLAACQDVVVAKDGSKWAQFASNFERQESDGTLVFTIQGINQQPKQEVTVTPGADQVANIDGRKTEFRNLENGQALNLYVLEGGSKFATEVGVKSDEIASTRGNAMDSSRNSDYANAGSASPTTQSATSQQKEVTLDNVQFALNSAELTTAAKQILDEHAREFSANVNTKYVISGHTSASASEEYNQALSERRAKAVMDYLVDVGNVDAGHLSTVGYGETRPIAREASDGGSNSQEAQANMRVDFETMQAKL